MNKTARSWLAPIRTLLWSLGDGANFANEALVTVKAPGSYTIEVRMEAILIQQLLLSLICTFLDCDRDVLCVVEACNAAKVSIALLHGSAGAMYFGAEGIYGLWRHLSPRMVATSCRMWSKLQFTNCRLETPELVEDYITAMEKATKSTDRITCDRHYFLINIDQDGLYFDGYYYDGYYAHIPSLNVCIWLIYSEVEDGLNMFFARRPEDEFEDEVKEMDYMRQFKGIGFLVPRHSVKSKPIPIPSSVNDDQFNPFICQPIESATLEVMRHRPTFVVVIWRDDALRRDFL